MYFIRYIIFLFLAITSFLYENVILKNCNKNTLYTYTLSFLHHIGSIYVVLESVLFGKYLLHLFIVLGVAILWIIFKDRCIVTLYYNKLCGLPESSEHKDLIYMINKYLKIDLFHYYIASIIILYDIVMLLKIYKII